MGRNPPQRRSSSSTLTSSGREGGRAGGAATAADFLRCVVLCVTGAVALSPLIYMLALSLRGDASADGGGAPVWFGPWRRLAGSVPLLSAWFRNSALAATITVAWHLAADTLAAYVLARRRFRGRGAVFALILLAMMVPRQITLIPLFLTMGRLGLDDTFAGLVLPGLSDVIGIFLLRQFIITIPESLLEAARMDGAGEWGVFIHVVVPLARPAMAVMGVLAFLHYWGDYFWPLVILHGEENFTLTVGLSRMVNSEFGTDYNLMAAGAAAAALPALIVFLAFRKMFFEWTRAGAVK